MHLFTDLRELLHNLDSVSILSRRILQAQDRILLRRLWGGRFAPVRCR